MAIPEHSLAECAAVCEELLCLQLIPFVSSTCTAEAVLDVLFDGVFKKQEVAVTSLAEVRT